MIGEINKRLGIASAREEMRIWSEHEVNSRFEERAMVSAVVIMALLLCWNLMTNSVGSLTDGLVNGSFFATMVLTAFGARSRRMRRLQKRAERDAMLTQSRDGEASRS